MTITTVAIACDIGLADNTEFVASRLDFALSGPDYDTASNDAIPAHTVSVTLDGSGVGTANLWPVDLGTRNTHYAVTVIGSYTSGGASKTARFDLGRIAPPSTGGPFDLADLLSQSSGSIAVGSTVYATIADAVAATLAAQVIAEAAAAAGADPIAATAAAAAAAASALSAAEYARFDDVAALKANTITYDVGAVVYVKVGFSYDRVSTGEDFSDAFGNKWSALKGSARFWNVKQFDIPNDGTNCADLIENAAAKIAALGGGTMFWPNGIYQVERSTFIPIGVSFECEGDVAVLGTTAAQIANQGTIFRPDPAASAAAYVGDFVFYMNVLPASPTTWVLQYPHHKCSASNFTFSAVGSPYGKKGFLFAGTYTFENILCNGVATLCAKPVGVYTDGVKVKGIFASSRPNATDFLVDLPGLGDGYIIDGIASGYTGNQTGMTKGVNLGPVRGGTVANLVNGQHVLTGGVYDVSSLHLEGGDIEIIDPQGGTLYNSFFSTELEENGSPVKFSSTQVVFGQVGSFAVENNTFSRNINRRGGWPTAEVFDIVTHAGVSLTLRNNVRRYTAASNIDRGQVMGITLSNSAGAGIDTFNRYSHVLSRHQVEVTDQRVAYAPIAIPQQTASISGLATSTQRTFSDVVFGGATATYYYNAICLLDPVRMAGRASNNGEISIAATNGGSVLTVGWDWGSRDYSGNIMLRIYRGTATGAYNQYADIPVRSLEELIDVGHAINGFIWKSRASGGIDTTNTGLVGEVTLTPVSAKIMTNGAVPTVGTWSIGDEVKRRVPTDGATGTKTTTSYYRRTAGTGHTTTSNTGPDWLEVQLTLK